MSVATVISKTDLARRTRYVLEQARRGRTMIVESYGEEQVAILDILDYRILRTVAVYHAMPPHPAPISESTMVPRGLDLAEVQQVIADADSDPQAGWNRIIGAYLDADISLGRAAEMLGLSRFELADRLRRLGLPLQIGPATAVEAQEEFAAFGCQG